jgi:glucose repression regulatory protein TUP1
MRLWNNETKTLITCVDFEDGVATVRISPDGHFVAVGTLDKHLKVWDCVKGSLMHVEDALRHKDSVYSVDFTHKARKILTASLDKTIKVWESFDEVWKCTGTFDGPANFALSVRSSIDDLWIICGSKDRAVYILDAQTGIVHIMLNGHKNSGECSQNGN